MKMGSKFSLCGKSDKGLTLVETILALAFVGIIAVGVVQTTAYMTKGRLKNLQSDQILTVMEAVSSVLGSNQSQCTYNLKNLVVGSAPVRLARAKVASISFHDDMGAALNPPVLKVGDPLGKADGYRATSAAVTTTQDISLIPMAVLENIDPANGKLNVLADLQFTFARFGSMNDATITASNRAPNAMVRHVPIWIQTVSAGGALTVASCATSPIPDWEVHQRNCETGLDGYQHWDGTGCVYNADVILQSGGTGALSMTCKPGYHPAQQRGQDNTGGGSSDIDARGAHGLGLCDLYDPALGDGVRAGRTGNCRTYTNGETVCDWQMVGGGDTNETEICTITIPVEEVGTPWQKSLVPKMYCAKNH